MKAAILIFAALMVGCTQPSDAIRALDGAGYKSVHIGGWAPYKCGEGDQYATEFDALGQNGKRVSGVVCSGFLKGSTIRTD